MDKATFTCGQKVRCTKPRYGLTRGHVYIVEGHKQEGRDALVSLKNDLGQHGWFYVERFEPYSMKTRMEAEEYEDIMAAQDIMASTLIRPS